MFHHDNRVFNEGDTIIGNHYDIRKNILSKYQSSDLFPNMSDVLYMTNRVRDSWDYQNVYQVVPKGKVVKCHTHYSVVLCQEEMQRCMDRFKKFEIRPYWSDDEIESKYIHLMYESYVGNSTAASTLDTYFGYEFEHFERYEWISESAKVVRRYMSYHDAIDSVVASSIMNPLFDMLKEVKDMEREYNNSNLPFNWNKALYDNIVYMFNF